MVYIDFDGVILDTDELTFEEWRKNPFRHDLPESEKIKYLKTLDWPYILNNSNIINDSIYYLNNMDTECTSILTKIHSMDNEGYSKIKWLRDNGVKQNIILVPFMCKKTAIVDANGNVLVDDCLKNIDDFVLNGGTGYFFDPDNDGLDSWHQPNTNDYPTILSLSKFSKKF